MKKLKTRLAAGLLPLFLCGCTELHESIPTEETNTSETSVYTEGITDEAIFSGTIEELPQPQEFSPADPLETLDIRPSDYFKPGVWSSTTSEKTGNFYIFDEDGIHGELIPMSDADGVSFVYSITRNRMTMYVGEELTPYRAELEKIDNGSVIIHMTYLGTHDELVYLWEVPDEGFTFYPSRMLAAKAEKYYTETTGTVPAGVDYHIDKNDMVIIDLWVKDENGWRKDVESYTMSMFTGSGWSSITHDKIDLSSVKLGATEEAENSQDDNIPDIEEPAT